MEIILHCRWDKILKAEQQQLNNKTLDEGQKALLASKSAVERALSEFESIKNQLEEVSFSC